MIELEKYKAKLMRLLEDDSWVRWIHEGTIPAYSSADKSANIELSSPMLGKHCSICLNINGCCFPRYNMPKYPLHPNCHCLLEPINGIKAKAECEIDKFTGYVFIDKAKKVLFESWGYDIIDSISLQEEFVRQANEKYASGDFVLGKLDYFGQRINIEIILPRKDKVGAVSFISGWMVYPDGVIRLTTPYGGK